MGGEPKLFISYSWTSPEHEQRVVMLASELREAGVDVILDKWDLKEGQDAFAFMEQMVTNKDICKVAMICDKKYAEKADQRAGGVGAESQIISKKVYESTDQGKFVAVVFEKDADGSAYVPTYYHSRIYIDLSSAADYAENFEKLLRWIYDKPLYVKPAVGRRPEFLDDTAGANLGTSAACRRAVEAIKNQKTSAMGALEEYFDIFRENLERFRLPLDFDDDALVQNIESFIAARNEFLGVMQVICTYGSDGEYGKKLHRFFERLLAYYSHPPSVRSWNETDYDNFKFIIHELYLYALAIALKRERFDIAELLFDTYYVPKNSDIGHDVLVGHQVFRQYLETLEGRNRRLGLRKLSLHAMMLKDRVAGSGLDLNDLMQADFVAFIRSELHEDEYHRWWPETLIYIDRFGGALEIFARSASSRYLPNIFRILGVTGLSEIDDLLAKYDKRERELPRWEFNTFNPRQLMARERLGSKP